MTWHDPYIDNEKKEEKKTSNLPENVAIIDIKLHIQK